MAKTNTLPRSLLTQKDIASACNVSRSTVAAVLGKNPSTAVISPKTQELVRRTAKKLGYRPHSAARSLRSGQTNTIALAVPNMRFLGGVVSIRTLHGIADRIQELGYVLSICSYEETESGNQSGLQRMALESRSDGFLLFGDLYTAVDPRETILAELAIPFVLLAKQSKTASSVHFDNIRGARLMVEHLLSLGHRRIAFVGRNDTVECYQERKIGYEQALTKAGVAIDPQLIFPHLNDFVETGRSAIKNILRKNKTIDAIFCFTDASAMTVIQELHECQLRVPQDIAVVGFDDTPMAALASPPLTTIHQDGYALGQAAVDRLLDQIKTKKTQLDPIVIPVRLVVRSSCGATLSKTL